jgi:hypothetical protein
MVGNMKSPNTKCSICGKKLHRTQSILKITKRTFCSTGCRNKAYPVNHGTFDERFWSKVKKGTGCWLWQAAASERGYGKIFQGRKLRSAHRVSWEIHNGKIPSGLMVLHRCDTPGCVRPDHLFLGTCLDNLRDAARKNRMHPGEANGSAKLTFQQVKEIREKLSRGSVQRRLAGEYGISTTAIWKIAHRMQWK